MDEPIVDPGASGGPSTPGTELWAELGGAGDLCRLGPYDIVDTLGSGGMGVVYRATDRRDGREVALKVLRITEADERGLRRFETEIAAVREVDHPGIVKVHASGSDGELHYCAMELVSGRTLAAWSDERERSIAERARMIALIARAVDHAHRAGVIHRDIKPGNVIVDWAADRPHVADFGLARAIGSDSSLTASSDAVGTPAYMAPEQARGQHRDCDARTDVWALGVMLYEQLVGTRPFLGESALDIMAGIVHRDPVSPRALDPTIPPTLERVIMQCLAKAQDRRYASAATLADDIDAALAGRGVRARRYGWVQRHSSRLRRIAVPALVAILTLGLIGVIGGWQYRSYHQHYGRWVPVLGLDFTGSQWHSQHLRFIDGDLHTPIEPWPNDETGLHARYTQWLWLQDLQVPVGTRIEIDVTIGSRVDGIEICLDGHLPAEAQNRPVVPAGYSCQFGGYGGTMAFISANPEPQFAQRMATTASSLEAGGRYTLRFERDLDTFTMSVDGAALLQATFPLPLGSHSGGIGIRSWAEDLRIRGVRVWRLAAGEAASPLLAADTMTRYGHHEDAVAEYRAVASAHDGNAIAERALARAVMVELTGPARETVIEDLMARLSALPPEHQHRRAADSALALHHWSAGDRQRALDRIEELVAVDPTDQTLMHCLALDRGTTPPEAEVSARIQALLRRSRGLVSLDLTNLGLQDLSCIAHLELHSLIASNNPLAGLSGLQGMPLSELIVERAGIDDLGPLVGLPLARLSIGWNAVDDLAPLRGKQLVLLSAPANQIRDLRPLSGMPLQSLNLTGNGIEDIGPLAGMDLHLLNLAWNRIADCGPLGGSSFGALHLSDNRIADLAPLETCRIERLSLTGNPAIDLSPLAATGVRFLAADGVPAVHFGELLADPPAGLTFGHRDMDPATADHLATSFAAAGREGLARQARCLAAYLSGDRDALLAEATSIGGRSMTFVPVPLTWDEATAVCARLGASLPRIDAAAQAQLMRSLRAHSFWIDLRVADGVARHRDGSTPAFKLVDPTADAGPVRWRNGSWLPSTFPDHRLSGLLLAWPRDEAP